MRKIIPIMFLFACATASAGGNRAAVKDFENKETALSRMAFQGESVRAFCDARRDVSASLEQLSSKIKFQPWTGIEQDKVNAANDLERLREYCDEIAKADAFSNEKLEEEPVAKRARELVIDLDQKTDTIVWASKTSQAKAR